MANYSDLYFNESGDIMLSPEGDIALTNTFWRDDIQQIYIRLMTDINDFTMYTTLGADLSSLYGLPQSSQTGALGVELIRSALERENRFQGKTYNIKAVPVGLQTIRFDISLATVNNELINISIQQKLGPA